jgi:hypothetical protein
VHRTGAAVVVLALALPSPVVLADDVDADVDQADPPEQADQIEPVNDDLPDHPDPWTEPCPDRSGVVGHRRCPAYGEWAVEWPNAMVRFGFNMRHLPRDRHVAAAAAAARTITTPLDDAASDTSYTISEQIGVAPTRSSYIAFEVEFSPTTAEPEDAGTRSFAAASHLVFGVSGGPRLVRFGAELAGGIRLVDTELGDAAEQGVLEVRARADLWLTPWLTLGAGIGTSLLDRGDWMTGVYLGAHSFAFGGQ